MTIRVVCEDRMRGCRSTRRPGEEDDCPFCAIVAGTAPAADLAVLGGDVFSFRPLRPVTPGHLLFVPRAHVRDAAADPRVAGHVFAAASATRARQGGAANLITSIGEEATQSVFHLHVHLVPRVAGDGLHLPWTGQQR